MTWKMSTNFQAEIPRIKENYENYGMNILHGLQKDNIQNSWGARINRKKGTGFAVYIKLYEENGFNAVIFQDVAAGLTGTKHSTKEEHSRIDLDDVNERLANFQEHKNIGISRQGQSTGGFVGQGKLISNLHSKNKKVYYDSLREDNEYLINWRIISSNGRDIELGNVKWGADAGEEIQSISNGNLKQLENPGTRIIIMDPTDDLIQHIKSGKMLEDIEYTWWEMLLKYNKIEGIFVHDGEKERKAECPNFFIEALEESDDKIVLARHEVVGFGRIKKAVFGFSDKPLPPKLNGIAIQRAQMPINQADDLYSTPYNYSLPETHKNKFYAIVMLDDQLENNVRELEHETHYTLNGRPTRGYQLYDRFKHAIMDDGLEQLKIKYNLSSSGSDSDENARRLANNTKRDINELFAQLGVSGGSKKDKKKDFKVVAHNIEGLKDPNLLNDEITYLFKIKNRTSSSVSAKTTIKVLDENSELVEILLDETNVELIDNKNTMLEEIKVVLDSTKYDNGNIYTVECLAKIGEEEYKDSKKIHLNIKKESKSADFSLSASIDKWPQANHRINTNEILSDIFCLVSSNIESPINVFLDIQLYNKENGGKLNGKIYKSEESFTLNPNGAELVDEIPDITFDDAVTDGIGEGQIYCRFNLIADEDYEDKRIGDAIASTQKLIYFNCDPPGIGLFEEIRPRKMGADSPQAVVIENTETEGYICDINSDHRSYKIHKDNTKSFDCYFKDITVRQSLLTCIKYDLDIPKVFDGLSTLDGVNNIERDELVNRKHGELLNKTLRRN
jgi:hypothetical protein